jgi:hypothetical protein
MVQGVEHSWESDVEHLLAHRAEHDLGHEKAADASKACVVAEKLVPPAYGARR